MLLVIIEHPVVGLSGSLVKLPKLAKDIALAYEVLDSRDIIVTSLDQLTAMLANVGYRFNIVPVDISGNPL